MNYLKLYFLTFKFWLKDLFFGVELKYPETQEDYIGGQCFYDIKTGKHECE